MILASHLLDISYERVLSYISIVFGISLLYFGFFCPQWFSKKAPKPSFKDDSYFWQVFPYGLFFLVGGSAFLFQPQLSSLLVALGCAAWVKILYKFV
ncbi:MAG TPA: hypothetical protein VIG33_05315 [Pseudobdellovibrionaceae bacterium]|jgi:O-antigen/teichoic acid export membrane protein